MRPLYSSYCRSRSRFADLLDDDLLGGLRGDAAEINGRQRIDDVFAELDTGTNLARRLDIHLRQFIFDLFNGFRITGQ